jgi:hypothetical protein
MLAFALLLASLPQAPPAADPETFDLRCFIAVSQFHQRTEGDVRAGAMAASIFYLARVDARIPPAELEGRLVREVLAIQGTDLRSLVQSCGTFMHERGRALTEIAERIAAREQAQQIR